MKCFMLCISLFATTTLMAAPAWFVNRELQMSSEMEMIGYGEDTELHNAIAIAKADISSQLESRVSSTIMIRKIRTDDVLVSNSDQVHNLHTESILEDVHIIMQHHQDGKWYVAIKYENIPEIKRFVKKLPTSLGPEHQNIYFTNTYLGKELNRLTGVKTNSKLYFMKGSFYLNRGDIYQKMTVSLPDLFITHATNGSNKLEIYKKSRVAGVLMNNEPCLFRLTSKKKYVSIFAVNPEGHVFVLEDNMPSSRDTEPYQFFRKDVDERPTMFVAVFSDIMEDNSFFRIMIGNEERESYENGKMKFDMFIEFLDGKEFVSKKILIK